MGTTHVHKKEILLLPHLIFEGEGQGGEGARDNKMKAVFIPTLS